MFEAAAFGHDQSPHQQAMATMQELAATHPRVAITYPEQPKSAYYDSRPSFVAAGTDLQDPESRQRALSAFEESTRLNGETHIIVTGKQEGQDVTLLLRRALPRGDSPPPTLVQGSAHGSEFFNTQKVSLTADGKTLQFGKKGYTKLGYEDMNSFDVTAMYLVPHIESGSTPNRDQIRRGNHLTRLFRRLSGKTQREIFLA